ncbi:kinesin-like protein KIF21A [Actinia tenebrosa]|uniref:Kinesin-like protein KIF21A n=1 Tax=Actinia tenebrosa TaxID=6105 RepID=A0A6P8IMG5_ACTTE|nr:kinesin-like protein KIF21A [Actinia tenebrosa]
MTNKGDDTSVRVALRIRPQSAAEQINMCRVCTTVTPGHPQVILGKDKAFTFDHVFNVETIQDQVYNTCVKDLVNGCLDGYNATVLAYGQTGSGKTYTMGTGFDVNIDPEEEGIVPRAVGHLFNGIEKRKLEAKQRNEPQPDFKVTVQFMELYNEDLIDLFDADGRGRKANHVKIHEDPNGLIYCMGVTMKNVKSALDTLNCLQQGALLRTTASTNMNTHSSRSHAIFTIQIKQQRVVRTSEGDKGSNSNYEYEMLSAKFNFVDLAGSERLKRTGATGDRAKEGISINCGLLALGNVISALGDVTKRGIHVPYRDSKLTRLLQDSLGGNSCTLMIACISPSDRDFMETLNTLKYANRARNIKNKVVVNQDKASKQISMLRAEIQKLTMELVEFRQGKRVSNMEGESDVTLENDLLKSENEKLRMRIKALSSTVDSQSYRITDLMSAKAMADLEGVHVDGGVENLIQNYLREIEELRNKLTQSEVMATAITRNNYLKSRTGHAVSTDSSTTILELAKSDLAKQKQKAQKLRKSSNSTKEENEETKENSSDDELSSGDEEDDDEEEEEDVDDNDDNDDSEEKGKDGSGDESSSSEENEDSEAGAQVVEELAELTTEIEIKEKLVEELEASHQRMLIMKTQYEEKLSLLTHKIKETEVERDQVLRNIKDQDSEAAKQAKHIKEEYEKKLSNLKTELKKLQVAKKNHAQLLRDKARNEQQLKIYTNELNEMKKVKARLMKQMKDEVAKSKQHEMAKNKEIAQLKKVSRMREIAIRNLETEKRQKELILKRKQDEVKALRRQQKPVSGALGAKKNQVTSQPVNGNEPQAENEPSGYGTYGYRGSSVYNKPYGGPPRIGLAAREKRKRVTIEQAIKMAKKKWDHIERKVGALVIQRQTISNLEKDMDRWIKNRNELSKQLEECTNKYNKAKEDEEDESIIQELKDQLEAHTLHMDYIQENIDSCQTCIIEMEDPGNTTTELNELISSCMLHEARALSTHFLSNIISLGQIISAKEATIKELEGLLEITKEHNTIQQTLLSHVLAQGRSLSAENLASGADPVTLNNVNELLRLSTGSLHSLGGGTDDGNLSSGSGSSKSRDKARRRTGCREDFLYPERVKAKKSPSLNSLKDNDDTNGPLVPTGATEFKPSKQISPELMQKLLELDKARKDANDNRAMNGNVKSSIIQSISDTSQSQEGDGKDIIPAGYQTLPASLVRGNLRSKSARNYQSSKYGPSPATSQQPKSQPSSPTMSRKNFDRNQDIGNDDGGSQKNENVFSRLTSNLGNDSDPDVGRMLPLRPPTGKPSALVCTYAATGHNSAVLSVDVTDDYMFTGSKDKTVKVWDLNTGEEVMSLSGHKRDVVAVRYCKLTKILYSVSQNIIKLWDLRQESGKCIKTLSPQTGSSISGFISGITSDTQINDLQISSTATSLYAAMGNTVRIWDLKMYSMTGKLGGHAGPVMAVLERRRDNDTLVFTGSRDHFIKIFELGEGSAGVQTSKYKLEPPHYDGVQCLSIRGTALFSGSRDNSIKKWDYTTQDLQQHLIGAHSDWICALDFLPQSSVLLSGCRRGVLKLWQSDTCQQICEVKAHRHPINAITTNSSCVFTASSDRLVRLWRVTGTLEEQLEDLKQSVQV